MRIKAKRKWRWLSLQLGIVFLSCPVGLWGNDRYPTLEVGDTIYQEVVVRSRNASSLIISHSKGISQISIGSLPPALQEMYGYDPKEDASRQLELEQMRQEQIASSQERIEEQKAAVIQAEEARRREKSKGDLVRFGTPPSLLAEVDLRSEFRRLGIVPRNQGRLPSCAVHAVTGAMEYSAGKRSGRAENLSEYYLYWATWKILGRYDLPSVASAAEDSEFADSGFQIREVLQALRSYGIPSAEESPDLGNQLAGGALEGPSQEVIDRARLRSRFRAFAVPGRDGETLLGNIVHALNANIPVVIGMGWPHPRTLRRVTTLEKQKPLEGYGHAVTLVGYRCPSGKMEDISFIFKNSWGSSWGAGGYGYVRYKYAKENLFEAYILEVE